MGLIGGHVTSGLDGVCMGFLLVGTCVLVLSNMPASCLGGNAG